MTTSSFTAVHILPCIFCALITPHGIYVRKPVSNVLWFVCDACVNKEVAPMIAQRLEKLTEAIHE